MKKTVAVLGICLLEVISFYCGCINLTQDSTQFSILSFDVEPGIIDQGGYANLSWIVTGASSVSIDNGIGIVALTGHRLIQPAKTTTYILTASNTTITKSATAIITVKPSHKTPPPQTPNITCIVNNDTNRITITSIHPNVLWSNITITTKPNVDWQVQDSNNYPLANIGVTATITTNVTVGDNIFVFGTLGNVTVTLKYNPTNVLLGSWTVKI